MAYGMNDRVREQVSGFAGGTIALTLPVSAVTGFQTFLAGWGASGTGEYAIVSGAQWEVGLGTLNAGGTTLTRTTVYNGSSGAGVAVNFTGGTMDCFGDIPAELARYLNMMEITVASAATCDIGAVHGSAIAISGTVTITSFGTSKNKRRFVRFTGAMILTHNGTSLILPGAVSMVTVAGDTAVFASDNSGNWRCLSYQRGSAFPLIAMRKGVGSPFTTPGANNFTPSVGATHFLVELVGGGGGGGGAFGVSAQDFTGGGGGSGGYSCRIVTLAQIQADASFTAGHITVTIGAAGAGGAATPANGGGGTATSFGALVIANGGGGGLFGSNGQVGNGGAGGVIAGAVGDEVASGMPGSCGAFAANNTTQSSSGNGGSSRFGGGGIGVINVTAGNAGSNYGAGGSGGSAYSSASGVVGGNGSAGMCKITEFGTA